MISKKETQLKDRISQQEVWLKKLCALGGELKEVEARYAVLGHLSEVANGKNRYGLTFQRFVLGALLDDVLVAATHRLQLMSRGRLVVISVTSAHKAQSLSLISG